MASNPGGPETVEESEGEFALRYTTIHGHRFGYRCTGEGPVLLLIHGIAGSSRMWIPVMEILKDDFTVVAPDLLGHGASDKPAGDYSLGGFANLMRDLLVVLGIERVTVVGQSFGGGVAMQFAYQFPDRCERLVLVDAGGLGREVNWILRIATLPAAEYVMPVVFPAFARDWGDSVSRFVGRIGFSNASALEVWRAYRSLTDTESRRAFLRTMRSVIDPGGQSVSAIDRLYLAQRIPTLIVWGQKDRIIPVSHAYQALEAAPHSRLEIMPDVGHFPQSEDPAGFATILRDFLVTTEPSVFTAVDQRDRLLRGTG